ncbi:S-methyl-5'-thioadenosine phosphorylase [Halobacteriovorax marinus]|uniref:S-methyl-5'-thioadenosine phosphorylase n=1 Tax=Halobacteriovorax marinus TaxID=97084 RepID=UPI003A92B8E9
MAEKAIGIIGGSGVYNIEGIEIIKEHTVETPFGTPSDKVIQAKLNGVEFYFLPRHGRTHGVLPHEVNYCANIYALKSMGVEYLLSVSAVGSLKEECPPGSMVLPDQFIDWTKGGRRRTFFGEGIVGHVSTAYPIDMKLQKVIEKACAGADVPHHVGGSYICIEGPQFSSKAESHIYRGFGATVIGMTNVPEAYLAKEAGMAYATLAMVTDYDCWREEEHCSVEEILKVMKKNNESAQSIIKLALNDLNANKFDINKENTFAIMTPEGAMTPEQIEICRVLKK